MRRNEKQSEKSEKKPRHRRLWESGREKEKRSVREKADSREEEEGGRRGFCLPCPHVFLARFLLSSIHTLSRQLFSVSSFIAIFCVSPSLSLCLSMSVFFSFDRMTTRPLCQKNEAALVCACKECRERDRTKSVGMREGRKGKQLRKQTAMCEENAEKHSSGTLAFCQSAGLHCCSEEDRGKMTVPKWNK